jgi:hypothetical protein
MPRRAIATALFTCAIFAVAAGVLGSQEDWFRLRTSFKGTLLLSHSPEAPLLFPERDTATSFWRVRFEPEARLGTRFTLGAAYEQRIRVFSSASGAAGLGILPPDTPAPYRIRQLDWSSTTSDSSWRHEIDRAYLAVHLEDVELTSAVKPWAGAGRSLRRRGSLLAVHSARSGSRMEKGCRRDSRGLQAHHPFLARRSGSVRRKPGRVGLRRALSRIRGELDSSSSADTEPRRLFGITSSPPSAGRRSTESSCSARPRPCLRRLGAKIGGAEGGLRGSYRIPVANGILLFVEYHYWDSEPQFGDPSAF